MGQASNPTPKAANAPKHKGTEALTHQFVLAREHNVSCRTRSSCIPSTGGGHFPGRKKSESMQLQRQARERGDRAMAYIRGHDEASPRRSKTPLQGQQQPTSPQRPLQAHQKEPPLFSLPSPRITMPDPEAGDATMTVRARGSPPPVAYAGPAPGSSQPPASSIWVPPPTPSDERRQRKAGGGAPLDPLRPGSWI